MRRHTAFTVSSVVLALAVATACGIEGRADAGPPPQAPTSKETGKQLWHDSTGQPPVNVSVPSQSSLAPLIKQLKPAVVNISSTTVMKNPHRGLRMPNGGGGGDDDENQQLFEKFFGQREMPEELKGTSLGSGFIINDDGYVLTNNHVVKDATDIKVRLSDGREFEAKIVGRDPASDVALIKLQQLKGKLPTVALGDSDALDQGDFVLAIGSPLGFRESVTFGIVSAKDRSLTGGAFDDFLQTDAAINQGNSGGPLFNMKGEVVGINTAIISPQIGSGIGFAVPINMAKQLVPQLLTGKVSRGYLGVAVSELTPDLVQGFGLKEGTKGALVQSVVPKAPADKAGVKPGDVVVAVNGKPVDSPSLLTRTVSSVQPGGKATLTVLRGNEKKDLTITVAQRPDEEALARGELGGGEEGEGGPAAQKPGANDKLGIRIAPVPPQVASELNVQPDQGVLVVAVNPNGPAGSAGVRKNDVILEVNRQPVNKVEQVVGLIQKMKPGQVVVLRVQRGQQASYLPVKLGGEKK
ncbi:peptidase [Anaeromyxobacter diazotrophicus]|uniref:Peptidase n=1 Tax=Anaeromyxobacter diazotrophicus TaxID=2590199 RepID=A0A7I9VQI9_9BACT|nr:peptidase [Anaeromyxobacter diazotrophicus]